MLEQRLHARDVRLDDLARTKDRAVDVGLGGEVDDRVAARGGAGDVVRPAVRMPSAAVSWRILAHRPASASQI